MTNNNSIQLPTKEEAEEHINNLEQINWKPFEGGNIAEYVEKTTN